MQAIIEYLKVQKQRQDAISARIAILEKEETPEQEADDEFSRELDILLAEIGNTELLPY